YAPFSSQLDWEIALWAVRENIGQGSLNRLLAIPGVKDRLGISFKDARTLFEIIDQLPERCGSWKMKRFTFKDRPKEHFLVHHRDPLEAIRGLWGDPAYAEHLVYKPGKFF
ncbi:hypothetical protein BT96DRAFT_759161, partial [Gymnopus androsaceus JB14]